MFKFHKWVDSLIGGFTFYMGGGDSGKSTTTQKADPWAPIQPYILDYANKAQTATSNPYQFYNGDTVADFSPEQQLGFNLTTQRALAGSPTQNAANNNITDTLNGKYLTADSNPYLQGMANQAYGDVTSRINSQFNNNNFGSSAHQELLTRGLTDAANNLYGGQYQAERNNQMQAANLAPSLANADYNDANALQGVGAQRQALANQYLGNSANAFNGAAQFPYDQLQRYGQAITGVQGVGSSGTSSTNQSGGGSSGLSTAIGLGLTAASLFSDVRLKSNIEKVGDHPLGIGIYDYDKFGKRERGVMAQEVEQVMPDAVATHPSGYKMVDYSKINGLLGA